MTPCRYGDHCRSRNVATREPAEATPRGLCLACERHGQYAISQLTRDWLTLSVSIGKPISGFGNGIPTSKASEAPLPLRVDIDELMRHIVWILDIWSHAVRIKVQLYTPPPGNIRPHKLILQAVNVLTAHYNVFLALDKMEYIAYTGDDTIGDGLDGIGELIQLHHRARLTVGESRAWEERDMPCPLPDGCGVSALGRWVGESAYGEDYIQCANCGWHCTVEQYAMYVMTLIPKGQRPQWTA